MSKYSNPAEGCLSYYEDDPVTMPYWLKGTGFCICEVRDGYLECAYYLECDEDDIDPDCEEILEVDEKEWF